MSLHALAGHMAAKGRGGDSLLVHMTPEEVQSLQAMALRAGGTLTINPETGLPEANILKDTFKALAPMALGAVLGPAGFGLSAAMAGAATGGITALATGSLSRGLMAGLGAYGGAGLGESLMGAGTGAMAASDIAAQQAAGSFPTLAEGATQEQIAKYAADVGSLRDSALSKAGEAGIGARLSAGAGQMANNPGMYAKEMLTGLAAISPMMADKGVQTTTPKQDTGTIRTFSVDPYRQQYTSTGNYPASEYKGMAQGGIVALAGGGVSDAEIQGWMAANQGADDKTIAAAMQQYGVSTDQLSSAMGYNPQEVAQRYEAATAPAGFTQYSQADIGNYLAANRDADIAAATKQFNADPRAVNQFIVGLTQNYADPSQTQRGTGTFGYHNALSQYGIDADELFAANRGLTPNYQFVGDPTTGQMARAYDVAGEFKGFNPAGNQLAQDIEWVKRMDTLGRDAVDIARATGLSVGEVQAREAAARAAMKKEPVRPIVPGDINTVPYLPGGVSGGGKTIVNPNGTITTRPNIPGMPEGGFTGIGQLKDIYTQGGGSLGYVNRAPENMPEFYERFGKQTGDSKAAYDYLIGKGAYPTKSGVGEIMRPYSEATLGIPAEEGRPNQKFLYDPATKTYTENPNYREVSYNTKGERIVGLTPTEVLKGLAPFKDATDDAGLFDFVTQNNISEAQLAAALGISLAEARARLAKAKTKAAASTSGSNFITDVNAGGASGMDSANAAAVSAADSAAAAAASATGNAPGSDGTPGSGAKNGGMMRMALGGLGALAGGGSASQYNLGGYSDGGRLLRGPGDGVSDSIPATIGNKQPARLADGEFVVPARIVSELGNGSTEAGARKLYAMMDRVQKARGKTTGKSRVAANTRADKYLPA